MKGKELDHDTATRCVRAFYMISVVVITEAKEICTSTDVNNLSLGQCDM